MRLQIGGDIDRMLGLKFGSLTDDPSVPGDTGLQGRVVSRVEPNDPAAPAEAGDTELRGIGFTTRLRKSNGRVEVGHDLSVGNLGDDLEDLLEVAQLRNVALASVHFGSDGVVTELSEPTADVLDVFVDAEDLLDYEDSRKVRPGGGQSPISWDLSVLDGDLGFTRFDTFGIGGDGLCRDGLNGECEAGRQRSHNKLTPVKIKSRSRGQQFFLHR